MPRWRILFVCAALAGVGAAVWLWRTSYMESGAPPSGPVYVGIEDAQREYAYRTGRRMETELASEIERAAKQAEAGDARGAIAALEGVAGRAGIPAVYNNIGVLFARMGDALNARQAYAAALERQPRYIAALANLRLLASGAPESPTVIQEVEPDNNTSSANTIRLGDAVTASIADLTDVDYFRFLCPVGLRDLMEMRVESRAPAFAPAWRLYDANGRLLQSGRDQIKPGESLSQTFSSDPGSAMFLEIYGKDRTTGAYSITVRALNRPDRYEPNEDPAHAVLIQAGEAIEANIMDDRDADWFRFTSPRSGRVQAIMEKLSPGLAAELNVMGPDMRLLGFGQNMRFEFSAELGETYYVQVWTKGSSGEYRLSVK